MADVNDIRGVRLQKLEGLRAAGIRPYADRFERTHALAGARALAAAQADASIATGTAVRVAGRVMTRRVFGKLLFVHLQDGSGRCQIVLDAADVGAAAIERFQRFVDLGDHIGVGGTTARTKKGEPSVWASDWTFLTKALLPLPEKWKGLADVEACQRARYTPPRPPGQIGRAHV